MEYEEIELADLASEIEKDVQAHKLYWKVTVDLYHQDDSSGGIPGDIFVFQSGEPKMNDEETERMLLHFFDLSLRKRIVGAYKEKSEREFGFGMVYGYLFDLEDSKDGQTNITSELIDALATIKAEYEPKVVMSFK